MERIVSMAGKRDVHGWSVEVEVAGGSTFFGSGRSFYAAIVNAFNIHPDDSDSISELLDEAAL